MKHHFAQYLVSSGELAPHALKRVSEVTWEAREPIGRLALMHGLLDPDAIERVLERQNLTREPFGQIAIRLGIMTPDQLRTLLNGQGARACVEMVEDLALSGAISIERGLAALSRFVASEDFQRALSIERAD